jgi:beta-mannosidase
MLKQSLNGTWDVRGGDVSCAGSVPGCVHLDLQAAGLIDDPFYRDNEQATLWVSETDWTYSRTFSVEAALLAHTRVILRCEGLDTLATIRVNGQAVSETNNMFRVWEFDVKPLLKAGENRIEVGFAAALPFVQAQDKANEPALYAWGVGHHKLNGGGWLRKQPSNFGWDWGPELTTVGIWRDITLIGISDARLCDVNVLQNHGDGTVSLDIEATVEQIAAGTYTVEVQVAFGGQIVAQGQGAVSGGTAKINLSIPDPKLWYPAGIGDQPLYEVTAHLKADGASIDSQKKRIGLRTLKLVRENDEIGQSFYFAVNGIPFFAKGANWIPADTFVTRLTEGDYRRLIQAARDANMNMLRVWGGGIYEPDKFYDICDELGICVWQDFMFACSTYPTYDQGFLNNAKAEAEDAVRRIRHHASIALWCGNNELEQGLVAEEWTRTTMSWKDYGVLFDDLLKEVVNRLAPQANYWPSSPHTPVIDRNNWQSTDYGDTHNWQVWHGRQPFEFYRTIAPRFVSEFGFQSFTEPRTTEAYTLPEDRNITSFIMEHHQRSLIGNSTIVHYMTDWYKLPTSFDQMLWLSQILQGMAIKYAVEHWRRNMPRSMGALFWQINDCWPVASWASIDYFGRWKALHYMAKRFYAPMLVSGVEDIERGTVDVWVTSDLDDEQTVTITWTLVNLDGAVLAQGKQDVTPQGRESFLPMTLDLSEYVAGAKRNVILALALVDEHQNVSRNTVTFARPKHLELRDPGFKVSLAQDGAGFTVTVNVEHPALYVWLSLPVDAAYSDNFFDVLPGQAVEVTLSGLPEGTTLADVQSGLKVQSLVDTYQ